MEACLAPIIVVLFIVVISAGITLVREYHLAKQEVDAKLREALKKYCNASQSGLKEVDRIRGLLIMEPSHDVLRDARRLILKLNQDLSATERSIVKKRLYQGTDEDKHDYYMSIFNEDLS